MIDSPGESLSRWFVDGCVIGLFRHRGPVEGTRGSGYGEGPEYLRFDWGSHREPGRVVAIKPRETD